MQKKQQRISNRRRQYWNKYKETCFYCRTKIPITQSTLDHVIPRSKGGKGGRNLVLACKQCNTLKGTLSFDQFQNIMKLASMDCVIVGVYWFNNQNK